MFTNKTKVKITNKTENYMKLTIFFKKRIYKLL